MLHARARRDLGVELGIAAELDRARIDERAEPGVEQLAHLVDRALDGLGAVPRVRGVERLAVVRDADVLVHQRATEVGAVDGSGDGLHGGHDAPAFVVWPRGRRAGRPRARAATTSASGWCPTRRRVGVFVAIFALRLGCDGLVVGAHDVRRRDLLPRRGRRRHRRRPARPRSPSPRRWLTAVAVSSSSQSW